MIALMQHFLEYGLHRDDDAGTSDDREGGGGGRGVEGERGNAVGRSRQRTVTFDLPVVPCSS